MSAYVIVYRESPVRDPAAIAEYQRVNRERANPSEFSLKPLVAYGAVHALEGTPPDGVVLLQFPTVEDAKAWYNSPAYQAAVPHRLKGADWRTVIVEGIRPLCPILVNFAPLGGSAFFVAEWLRPCFTPNVQV